MDHERDFYEEYLSLCDELDIYVELENIHVTKYTDALCTCVTIHEIRGKQVRLSIDADKSINIVRGELVDGKSTNKPYVRRKKEDRVGLSS